MCVRVCVGGWVCVCVCVCVCVLVRVRAGARAHVDPVHPIFIHTERQLFFAMRAPFNSAKRHREEPEEMKMPRPPSQVRLAEQGSVLSTGAEEAWEQQAREEEAAPAAPEVHHIQKNNGVFFNEHGDAESQHTSNRPLTTRIQQMGIPVQLVM